MMALVKRNLVYFLSVLLVSWLIFGLYFSVNDQSESNNTSGKPTDIIVDRPILSYKKLEQADIAQQIGQAGQVNETVNVVETQLPETEKEKQGRTFEDAVRQAGPGGTNEIFVNISPIEREIFQVIQTRLDDPSFYSTVNLNEFTNSDELQSLPETLQLILLSKALRLYNQGYIDHETFTGIAR